MKKIIISSSIFMVICLGLYLAYKVLYPRIIAQAVVDKKYINLLPKKYNEKINVISDSVNSKLDKVIASSSNSGININQLEEAVLEIRREDVELIYMKLRNTKISSVEQVFDTISNNLKLKSLDVESFREPFLFHVEKRHIKRGMKYIETHDLFNTIDEESAKQIALQILKQKESIIKKKLKEAK